MSVATANGPDDSPALMWGNRKYEFDGTHLRTGNRCGHRPDKLALDRLSLPQTKTGFRIRVLDRLIEKAQAYFADPASVPLLAYLSGKKNSDGSPRQNRSETREAEILILCAIFAALDLKSLRVGNYTIRGEFKNLSFNELARRSGLTRPEANPNDPEQIEHVACSRFWRGIHKLKTAGVIDVFEQYEVTEEGMRGRPAIKTVSQKFLRLLGGYTKAAMESARKKASRKVSEFLGGAALVGIQSKDEEEQLTRDLQSERVHKQLSTKPVRKNQFPASVDPDNSTESLKGDYDAYVKAFKLKIEAQLGRKLVGTENVTLFAKYGGLTGTEWRRRRFDA